LQFENDAVLAGADARGGPVQVSVGPLRQHGLAAGIFGLGFARLKGVKDELFYLGTYDGSRKALAQSAGVRRDGGGFPRDVGESHQAREG
jgi:hypothetical protein